MIGVADVREVRVAVAALARDLEPDAVPLPDAVPMWEELDALERHAVAAKTLLARRVEESRAWQRAGHRSAVEFLAAKAGSSIGAARAQLDASKKVQSLPPTAQALRDGDLPSAQAAVMVDAAAANPGAEQRLLGRAKRASFAELREESLRVRAAADTGREATQRRIHRQRHLRTWTDAEGAWNPAARGTVADCSRVMTTLQPLMDQQFTKARGEDRREDRDGYAFDALVTPAARKHDTPPPAKRAANPTYLGLMRLDLPALQRGHTRDGRHRQTPDGPARRPPTPQEPIEARHELTRAERKLRVRVVPDRRRRRHARDTRAPDRTGVRMPEPDPHDPEPRDATMERAGADGWDALRRAVRVSGLAVGLLHLPSRRFLELSSRAMSLLGLESADLSRLDVATLSDDPEATSRALDLIAAGILDAYRARRRLRGRDDAPIDSFLSVRVIARETDHSHAVATVTDPSDDARRDLQQSDAVLIVGMIDESQQIESISSECEPILGHPSVEYLLTPLLDIVHPGDVARVLAALEEARASDAQVGVLVRVRDDAEAWRTLRLVINAVGEDRRRFGFALVPVDETAPVVATSGRVGELEERLRRIAREIEATGLIPRFDGLPNPREVPGLEDLSSRQWEVLSRLLSGERVPAIARSMYLSQSTVRNHLATIFRRVGVHSQAELLDRLRPRS